MPPLSQPPVTAATTPSTPPRSLVGDAFLSPDEGLAYLRAELEASGDAFRHARLLADIGEFEERTGDDAAALRDYQAAYNVAPAFREPLEGLLRLFEKRHNVEQRGKAIRALVAAATAPDEKVRALRMWADFLADVTGDAAQALSAGIEATQIEGAVLAEQAAAWLDLELLASVAGDAKVCGAALTQRALHAGVPAWRALLLIDSAREALASGDIRSAGELFEEAQSFESTITWHATLMNEEALRSRRDSPDPLEARASTELWICAMQRTASLVEAAMNDGPRGDALGVPAWVRRLDRLVDYRLRIADARRRLGQFEDAAAILDRTRSTLVRDGATDGLDEGLRIADTLLSHARMRIAEHTGDSQLAAELAERLLRAEPDGATATALAMRIAERAAALGDVTSAVQALSRALECDPKCLPARTLLLDVLATSEDKARYCEELEKSAEQFQTDDARGRTLLLAAYVWAAECRNALRARGAIERAAAAGVPAPTVCRVARMLASLRGDASWLEAATDELLAKSSHVDDAVSLQVELLRMRRARGDLAGEERAIRDLAASPGGEWLASVLGAYWPSAGTREIESSRNPAALRAMAGLEPNPDRANGLRLAASLREAGNVQAARAELHALLEASTPDPVVASVTAAFDRAAGDAAAAQRALAAVAESTDDPELGLALRLEGAFGLWLGGARQAAFDELVECGSHDIRGGDAYLGWAARGVDPDDPATRRRALGTLAGSAAWDPAVVALERFALELAEGNAGGADEALAEVERSRDPGLALSGALARVAWSSAPGAKVRGAVEALSQAGPCAREMVMAEQFLVARASSDPQSAMRAAREWFEAGGKLPAACEWISAAMRAGMPGEERLALVAIAGLLEGDAREALLANAALLAARSDPETAPALAQGESPVTRLANLELAPPGSDPRRRGAALCQLGDALGDDAEPDANMLAGWSALVAGDLERARAGFAQAVEKLPGHLAAWEGLRSYAELAADRPLQARCAARLGALCSDAQRAGAFWEEAGLLWLLAGDEPSGMSALEEAVAKDPSRSVAFDKLFRWVRSRKDHPKLLALIERRMQATDDVKEIETLTWERARALREHGDNDGALEALQQVTLLAPDHVGALALLGEINIRRGRFEEAAGALARVALLDTAPPKNRVTAGVAAVDLYENKLGQFDQALAVLSGLHRAKLSTLPVRERLARAAARTGAWSDATAILEVLMTERPTAEGRIEAARLAMAIHRDRLGGPAGAIEPLRKLLEELPADGEAIDVLLDRRVQCSDKVNLLSRSCRALLETLGRQASDRDSAMRLVRLARELTDAPLERAGIGVLRALGAADPAAEQAFLRLAAGDASAPRSGGGAPVVAGLRAPGDEGPLGELFSLIGPALTEALGPTLASYRVGRRERLDPRAGLALWSDLAAWAEAIGVGDFEVYVGGSDPLGVVGMAGSPTALVVGAGLNAPLSPASRARVARELLGAARGTRALAEGNDAAASAVVGTVFNAARIPCPWEPTGASPSLERLIVKAMPGKARKALPGMCQAVAANGQTPEAFRRAAIASLDRISAVACGDPLVALGPADASVSGSEFVDRTADLLRFVLSPAYFDARRALGLEGGAA
jgi:lipopolysaccharide biosynthesis regulator YciM